MGSHEKRRVVGTRERASYRYSQMESRCRNGNNCNHLKNGIKVIVEKEDFISWFIGLDFDGASVDRIDPLKHYEWGNIQVIAMSDNCSKDKKAPIVDGKKRCRSCDDWTCIDALAKDKRLASGVTNICKKCDNKRRSTGK